MINTCQYCGGWFPPERFNKALENKETYIQCRYCQKLNEFQNLRSNNADMSGIDSGYDYLSTGDFFHALEKFKASIKFAEERVVDTTHAKQHKPMASSEAYLGAALAQMHIQVIYNDQDKDRKHQPVILCHTHNDTSFADNEYYINARTSVLHDLKGYPRDIAEEHTRLACIQEYVDDFQDAYTEIQNRNAGKPNTVFIAYEDDPNHFNESGYAVAKKVLDFLPDSIAARAFLPYIDMTEYSEEERGRAELRYEAETLYALRTAKCMLVIADNSIDARLTSIYTRFYFNNRYSTAAGKTPGNNLGFVCYQSIIPITLPGDKLSQNIYGIADQEKINQFAYDCNGIIRTEKKKPAESTSQKPQQQAREESATAPKPRAGKKPYTILEEHDQVVFGHYPQTCVSGNRQVMDHFAELGLPYFEFGEGWQDNGWQVLLCNRKGKPYTWIRDEVIGEKTYRGVYFRSYREVYSVQETDQMNDQSKNRYSKQQLHCFEFQPLIWNIAHKTGHALVLLSDRGLDSKEYNNTDLVNAWEESTLHSWLNSDFLMTAFTQEERLHLGRLDTEMDDRVYLPDRREDVAFYEKTKRAILGSDYFRCLGGMGADVINYFWIAPHDVEEGETAPIVYHDAQRSVGEQYVDCTNVAVLPKIILQL